MVPTTEMTTADETIHGSFRRPSLSNLVNARPPGNFPSVLEEVARSLITLIKHAKCDRLSVQHYTVVQLISPPSSSSYLDLVRTIDIAGAISHSSSCRESNPTTIYMNEGTVLPLCDIGSELKADKSYEARRSRLRWRLCQAGFHEVQRQQLLAVLQLRLWR